MTNTTVSFPEGLREAIADALRAELLPALEAAVARAVGARSSAPTSGRPEFVSISQALHVLHVSRTQIYRLFAQGELTPIKRGRSTLVHRDDLQQFVDRLRAGHGVAQVGAGSSISSQL